MPNALSTMKTDCEKMKKIERESKRTEADVVCSECAATTCDYLAVLTMPNARGSQMLPGSHLVVEGVDAVQGQLVEVGPLTFACFGALARQPVRTLLGSGYY